MVINYFFKVMDPCLHNAHKIHTFCTSDSHGCGPQIEKYIWQAISLLNISEYAPITCAAPMLSSRTSRFIFKYTLTYIVAQLMAK